MEWSKLLSEISLMLPSDIFLTRLEALQPASAAEPGKLSLDGKALDYPNDVPDLGYKSVAKLMVRLAELDQLKAVWLSQSSKPAPTVSQATPGTPINPDSYHILFALTADIVSSSTPTATASGVPAPPTP
jgi:hypothetical protein